MNAVELRRGVPTVEAVDVWSSSEPVHCCLRDVERTETLLRAIARTVRPGDTVVEAGAGSGILSLAAARAGAARVFAIEIDPLLAAWAAAQRRKPTASPTASRSSPATR